MFRNPWEIDWNDPRQVQQQTQRPSRIAGPEREPTPMYPEQRALNQEQVTTEQLRQEALRASIEQRSRALSGQAPISAQQRNALRERRDLLPGLERQINEIEQQFRQNFEGSHGSILGVGAETNLAGRIMPNWLRPANERFSSASDSLIGAIASIQGLTGGEMNSLAELRARFGPMLPQAGDSDTTIREKIARLRAMVADQRSVIGNQLGEPDLLARGRRVDIGSIIADVQGRPPPGQGRGELRFLDELPDSDPMALTDEQKEQVRQFATRARSPEELAAFVNRISGGRLSVTPESAREALEHFRETGQIGGIADPAPPDISDARGQGGFGEGADAFMRGAADVPSLGFADEIAAVGDTLFGDGTYRQNLRRQRAIDAYDNQNNFPARMTGQLGGAFLLPTRAPQAFAAGGARGGAGQLAREGAMYGGGYGFGSTEGNIAERIVGGAAGAALGAPTGYAGGRLFGGLAARASSPTRSGTAQAAQDARALGIDLMPADVAGPITRRMTGIAYQTPFGTAPVTNAARRTTDQAGAARDRIAASMGQAVDPAAAGETAQRGARSFVNRTSARGGDLYSKAERMAEGVTIQPQNAVAALERNIAELSQIPGGAEGLSVLNNLRSSLSQGSFTVQGLRGMRTALRDSFASQGLRGSDIERRVNQVIDAASQDIVAGLTTAGRGEAARTYQLADRYWRSRVQMIDEVLEPIVGGGRSGEQVVQAIQSASRANTARVAAFMRTLPEDEARTVRATLIAQLGRSAAGGQNAEGTAFSIGTFLTHWNQIQPAARRAMFGPEATSSLNRLARVADVSKQAQRYQNFSNTGAVAVGGMMGLSSLSNPVETAIFGALQYGGARLLASPKLARWIAGAPKNPRAIPSYARGLTRIARTEPAIAADIMGLQQRLMEAFGQSPLRAAAEEERY